jgi:hypothetical protein
MTRRATFTQAQYRKVIRAAKAEGASVVRITPGAIDVDLSAAPALPSADGPTADEVFNMREQRA